MESQLTKAASASLEPTLVDGPLNQSIMWAYFEKSSEAEAVCNLCAQVCRWGGNTSRLFRHLMMIHPNEHKEARQQLEVLLSKKRQSQLEEMASPVAAKKPRVMKIRYRQSLAWKYYEVDSENRNFAQCKLCFKKTQCLPTTNLFRHLKSAHPKLHEELITQRSQGVIVDVNNSQEQSVSSSSSNDRGVSTKIGTSLSINDETGSPNSSLWNTSLLEPPQRKVSHSRFTEKDKMTLNKLLVRWLTHNMIPVTVVDSKEFKEFTASLNSRYQLPSSDKVVKSFIPEMAEVARNTSRLDCQQVAHCALSFESWMYRHDHTCATLVAHYIKNTWEHVSVALETCDWNVDTTDEIKRITDEWGITGNVFCVVSDHQADNVATAGLLMGWDHLMCFGHLMNCVVMTAIESVTEVNRLRMKSNEAVDFLRKDLKAAQVLRSVLTQHNLPDRGLPTEEPGRWVSTFQVLEHIVEQHEALNTVLTFLNLEAMCLCDDDVDKIRSVIEVLSPFEAAMNELTTDQYVPISKVVPLISLLQEVTNFAEGELVDLTLPQTSLRATLMQQMQLRFENLASLFPLAASTLLDPRFKHHAFTDTNSIHDIQEKLLQEIISTSSDSKPITGKHANTTLSAQKEVNKKLGIVSLWNSFDKRVSSAGAQKTTASEAGAEWTRYLREAVIPRTADPLEWWKLHGIQFPLLQRVVQKYLCIPANSLSSSRLFTKKGMDLEKRRDLIEPADINSVLFLSSTD